VIKIALSILNRNLDINSQISQCTLAKIVGASQRSLNSKESY